MEQQVSSITGLASLFVLSMGVLLLLLPRRYALLPIFIAGCYMTLGQTLMIGPLHFSIYRILVLAGWIRIFLKREIVGIKFSSIDKILVVYVIISSLLHLILRQWSSEAIISRLGFSYDTIGIYFLLRALVQGFDDIINAVKQLGIIIIPLAVLFLMEMKTGRNLFSIFGGVPEISMIREGRLRCQGPFQHPILAGTFGATTMPFFVGLWFHSRQNRLVAVCAFLAATFIVISSSSSGPLMAYVASMIGLFMWVFRSKMRQVRFAIVIMLLSAHILMKAPVWFLLARISDIVGGGGWHRAALIDEAFLHFGEWWLMGTRYTAHWMATSLEINPNMADITNQFISIGISGGLLSMCLFIWLIVKCFKITGTAISPESMFTQNERFMIWGLGCVLFSHVVSFLSVTYFDQIIIFWNMLLAMIAVTSKSDKGREAIGI